MEEDLQPGKVALDILVHTSARVTNADDDMYRKQARALSAYLNDRAQAADRIDNVAESSALVKQTPMTTRPSKEHKVRDAQDHFNKANFAIAESILISASSKDSASSQLVGMSLLGYNQISMVYNWKFKSPSSSTASVLGESLALATTAQNRMENTAIGRHQVKGTDGSDQETDSMILTTFSTASITISPDSAGFILHSPTYIQTRKRKLLKSMEEPCKAQEAAVLSECSPNTGRKRQRLMTIAEKGSATKIYDTNNSHAEPGQWVGSIAQFSSSVAIVPTRRSCSATASQEPAVTCRTYFSPFPETGIEPYKSHKVGVFAFIAGNPNLCNAYKPKSTKRLIEPLERGYWHLKIPFSWSTKAQDDFWSLLEDMIVQGKCGWGNWIEHVDASSTKSSCPANVKGKKCDPSHGSIAEIKIWCWGEVIREMWLAVLMASRRQTMRLGMAWHDSCGDIVVQMR